MSDRYRCLPILRKYTDTDTSISLSVERYQSGTWISVCSCIKYSPISFSSAFVCYFKISLIPKSRAKRLIRGRREAKPVELSFSDMTLFEARPWDLGLERLIFAEVVTLKAGIHFLWSSLREFKGFFEPLRYLLFFFRKGTIFNGTLKSWMC